MKIRLRRGKKHGRKIEYKANMRKIEYLLQFCVRIEHRTFVYMVHPYNYELILFDVHFTFKCSDIGLHRTMLDVFALGNLNVANVYPIANKIVLIFYTRITPTRRHLSNSMLQTVSES